MAQLTESSASQINQASSPVASIPEQVQRQRQWFSGGQTRSVEFRLQQLKALRQAVIECQDEVMAAVAADLRKPAFEGFATEVGVVREIDYAIKHLRRWVKPQSVPTSIDVFPAKAKIHPEPLGVVLIISPWNYPFQLALSPLVGAIAAGNCAVLKPSELAPNTSAILAKLIQATFDPNYITVVEGGVETSQALLAEKFDHIFFTGGTAIGKIIMEAAAKHLTPVTLELGGKSPCIVDSDTQIDQTAKRIVWGKFVNTGQTCIAPDYLLVNRSVKSELLAKMKSLVQEFYGENPAQSADYGRIISDKHFQRLKPLLESGSVVVGGEFNEGDRYIAPTILDNVAPDALVMEDEIFGPILPVLDYDSLDEAIAFVNQRPKPLALYLFSTDSQVQKQVLTETTSGNACVNDTIMQVAVSTLPFGGVGNSGMGSYHGKSSFDTFSHFKSVLYQSFWFDFLTNWRYAPYTEGKLNLIKKMFS